MTDPYKVLGISPSATEDEIKTAYRTLAKKYHPDNYADSPLNDLASEKMKEINEAYDEVMRQHKAKASGAANSAPYGWGQAQNQSYGDGSANSYGGSSSFTDVRNMIRSGRIADAEQILNGVPSSNRDAEWYFLKGTVLYRRGWMDDAYSNLQVACQRDPSNTEYRAALNQVEVQRNGNFGGYNTQGTRGTSGCDICSSLICADCCCECMGGDLIPCC